jgi:ParB/RepB/Spo0J family partition protein
MNSSNSASRVPVLDLPISKIFVNPARKGKHRYDLSKDEKMQLLKENISLVGILQPISVREIDGKYQIVYGHRRWWCAKQLGMETIPARIDTWSDKELTFIAITENYHRSAMTPVQEAKAIQELFAIWKELHGEDLGRAIGGRARSSKASRDPETGRLQKGVVGSDKLRTSDKCSSEKQDSYPATELSSVAGHEEIEGPDEELSEEPRERAFSSLLAEEAGETERQARKKAKVAKAFTKEQLEFLDHMETSGQLTLADLTKLAKIEDEGVRGIAINLVASGSSVDTAIAEAPTKTDSIELYKSRKAEKELSDRDWVKTHCDALLQELQDARTFTQEAILYRHANEDRYAFQAKTRKEVLRLRKRGRPWPPYAFILARLFWVNHPNDWQICHACTGRNADFPDCEACHGAGYKVTQNYPRAARDDDEDEIPF